MCGNLCGDSVKGSNMKNLFVFLLMCSSLVSGCTFNVAVLTPAPATVVSSPTELPLPITPIATTAIASPIATISATAVPSAPTLDPSTSAPIFFNGRSAATQEDHLSRSSSFPAGTKIVYVVWDYDHMREGMTIRREWYLNGQPWLTREEPWDYAKYGSTGTMRDVSIHDDVVGLDAGTYHLRIYIDNVLQPLGSLFYAPIQEWVTFEIGLPQEESFMGYGSLDGKWGVEVYGGKRVVLKNVVTGESRQIAIVQEVPYVNWFNDSKHFLFVDRDRSEVKPGTTIGIRDHLWIVDVTNGAARRVYKGDTSFVSQWGPLPSLDGKYIASRTGSAFADGCYIDSHLTFFEVAADFQSVKAIRQQDFTGFPSTNEGWIYPAEDGHWENESTYAVKLDGVCDADKSKLGDFQFKLPSRTAAQVVASTNRRIPGDLGIGTVHGKVTNASGAPVANATVICEHHSYNSPSYCAGVLTTNAEGTFAFNNVFFHDSDTIKVTVQAAGYETITISQSAFTTNDWEANVVLNKLP
jgi:hypothetical protein